jgi:Predicted membrane protein
MLLPKISSALVLLTLRLYDEIVSYVHEVNIIPLLYFFFRRLISLFTFVPFMNKMLNEYKESTMSILTGLMIGSLITLWPWKETYDKGSLPVNLPFDEILERI